MKGRSRSALLLTVGLLTVGGCKVYETGHVDLVAVRANGSWIEVGTIDHTAGTPEWVPKDTVLLVVGNGAATTVPASSAYRFLGPAGAPLWILPQTQNPAVVWPGWDTNGVPPGFLVGDRLEWELVGVLGDGPVHLYTTGTFGTPTVLFDSDDPASDRVSVPIGTHAHGSWAFGASGSYILEFVVRGTRVGGGPVSDTLHVVVTIPPVAS